MEFADLFHSLPKEIIQHHVLVELDPASLTSCRAAFRYTYTIDDLTIYHGVTHGDSFIQWLLTVANPKAIFVHACAQGVDAIVSLAIANPSFYWVNTGIIVAAAYGHDKIVGALMQFSIGEYLDDALNMALMQGHKKVIHRLNPKSVSANSILCAVLSGDIDLLCNVVMMQQTEHCYSMMREATGSTAWLLQRLTNWSVYKRMYEYGIYNSTVTSFTTVFYPAAVQYLPKTVSSRTAIFNIACLFDQFDTMEKILEEGLNYHPATDTVCFSDETWEWLYVRQLLNVGQLFCSLAMTTQRYTRIRTLLDKFPVDECVIANFVCAHVDNQLVIKRLIEVGVCPNIILAEGVLIGRYSICRLAINAGAHPTTDTRRAAIQRGELTVIKYIWECSDVVEPDAIRWAIEYQRVHLLPWLIEQSPPTAQDYIAAAASGNRKCICALMRAGLPTLGMLLAAAPATIHKYIKSFYRPE